MDANTIYDTLMGSSFERWYQTTFMDYVTGEEGCKTREEIKVDIAILFKAGQQ